MAPPSTNGGATATATAAFLFLCLLSLSAPRVWCESITAALSDLQSSSPNGVIRLNDTLLRRIHSLPTPRPFHFLIFFDAKKLHSRSELGLPALKSEYSIVASSFLTNNRESRSRSHLLFFDVEFEESEACFSLFNINTLPHIRLVPSAATDFKTASLKLDPAHFATLTDSMPEFIFSETSIPIGPIHRPPILSRSQIAALAGAAAISAPYLVRKVASGRSFVHEKSTWMAASIFVYFFSVSGAMFNIIRKVPMFVVDRRGEEERVMFFYEGAGAQLGAEGLAVGSLYTVAGLVMAFVCHALVRVRERKWQRLAMAVALLVSFWAVRKVISLNNWKTGYRIRPYWPSYFRFSSF